MDEAPRYRFGPLERRGSLAGLRISQIVVLAIGALVAVAAARTLPASAAFATLVLVGLCAAASAFVPIGGRTFDEWIPVISRWLLTGFLGERSFVSAVPSAGLPTVLDPQPDFPPALNGISILSVPLSGASRLGVIKDSKLGTYTGVLSVQGRSFALLDDQEKQRRVAAWGGVLASLAREAGVVHRFQWVERTVPDPGDEVASYLKDNLAVPLDSMLARSYLEVVDQAGPVTQQHETFLAIQIHAGRCARAVKAAGGGDVGACEVVRRELTSLTSKLAGSEVNVKGALTPRLIAATIRHAYSPSSRQHLAQVTAREGERLGTSISNAGPVAATTEWGSYRTDDAWHATYWIAEWPRVDVETDFLSPLLLRTEKMRAVAITMEPVSPLRAIRKVESARTSAAADEELRNRAGFVTTARRAREHDALADHERDLSHGHAFYRFAGFVTVTAESSSELQEACAEIEEAAARSLLDVRRLSGQQDLAFTYTLPLCRGLK
jgi:hypothetical protein